MIKVLVPYDFSEQAQNALNFTTGLADKITGIHVEVIHVMEVPYVSSIGTMGGGESMPEMENQIFFLELREKRNSQMEELIKSHQGKKYSFSAKIKLGNAFKSISESIVEENPDLVVMGSKGSSGMEEVLIGSNTEKVVRTATCPVITVKTSTDPGSLKKIVFASDFKEDNDEIAKRMKNLQGLFNAQLYFVVVNTPANFETTRESINRIKLFAKNYGFEGVKAEIYNSRSEESGIIEFAEDIDADLIAMATHGRTGFLHLITGSIAEDVVNHAKRPVWTYKVK
ncbi:universal stress protein [Algoriphagus aestuarii]|nr:universal stress protein [Algoriphagus aestuarii]